MTVVHEPTDTVVDEPSVLAVHTAVTNLVNVQADNCTDTRNPALIAEVRRLRSQALSFGQIAQQIKIPKSTVALIVRREVNQLATQLNVAVSTISREDITRKMFELAPKMLANVESLANGAAKEEVQLKASTDLLDRAGFSPVQKSVQLTLTEEMSRDELVRCIREAFNLSPVEATSVQSTPQSTPLTVDVTPAVSTQPLPPPTQQP